MSDECTMALWPQSFVADWYNQMYKYKIKTRQQLSWEEEWSAKNGNDLLLSLWSSWLLFIQSKSSICQYQTQFSYLAVDCTVISIKTCISWPVTQSPGINVTRNYFLYISFIGEDISDFRSLGQYYFKLQDSKLETMTTNTDKGNQRMKTHTLWSRDPWENNKICCLMRFLSLSIRIFYHQSTLIW